MPTESDHLHGYNGQTDDHCHGYNGQGATWTRLWDNNRKIMSNPEAQKKWAAELDAQGMVVNFNSLIPSIGMKEIHVSSRSNEKA